MSPSPTPDPQTTLGYFELATPISGADVLIAYGGKIVRTTGYLQVFQGLSDDNILGNVGKSFINISQKKTVGEDTYKKDGVTIEIINDTDIPQGAVFADYSFGIATT